MQYAAASAMLRGMDTTSFSTVRRRLLAAGQVQGVGFRPFVYRLARSLGLTGHVGNTSDGVRLEIQGPPKAVEDFCAALPRRLPPLARLTSCVAEDIPPLPEETAFVIAPSAGRGGHHVLISPDVAPCPRCLADMADPANRRHGYAFTNCTNCGPRFTITRAIPYDRAVTSMACFPLCPRCRAEYENPLDRRFHAQPNACPVCGPHIWLTEAPDGPSPATTLPEAPDPARPVDAAALDAAAAQLLAGRILALKGLGGFHLACDAADPAAVAELRRRKNRPHKPLAVMVPDLATVRAVTLPTPHEEALLTSPERPIVLCARRPVLPDLLAPDAATLGLMLPYTPFHVALFEACRRRCAPNRLLALVMTSGNAAGEPICLGNREALTRLRSLADAFVLHNRDILVRADDSVVRSLPPSTPLFCRRARGQTPRPVFLDGPGPCVLGAGPQLKATLCLTRDDAAFVSQHVGDLENAATFAFYEAAAAHLETLLEARPQAVVRDSHPDYPSSRFARRLAEERRIPLWDLQHHFAHAWSVLAENRHEGPALALTLDGTGLGDDGTIWGGELLLADTRTLEQRRLGRLSPFALPGGEAAIREPWRIAQGLLASLGRSPAVPWADEAALPAVTEMIRRGVRCPLTSSCGRLFDAVSALLGLCRRTTYEGQAAVRLEAAQTPDAPLDDPWNLPFHERHGLLEIPSAAVFAAVLDDLDRGLDAGLAATRFHGGLAALLARLAAEAARRTGISVIGLSGGVLQNATLAALLPDLLRRHGLTPLVHTLLPPNDGGLSLGQAAWGRRRMRLRGASSTAR